MKQSMEEGSIFVQENRQREVCLTEHKLFKQLPGQGKAWASLNGNREIMYKVWGTAAAVQWTISSGVELYCRLRTQ